MVCDRCKIAVQKTAEGFQAKIEEIQLGRVVLETNH